MKDKIFVNMLDYPKEFSFNLSDIDKFEKQFLKDKEIKDKLEIEVDNSKFIVKFADNTEFDITKGFSIQELMRIQNALFHWSLINGNNKELKDKIGFLINMKINNKRKDDTNNI